MKMGSLLKTVDDMNETCNKLEQDNTYLKAAIKKYELNQMKVVFENCQEEIKVLNT